MTAREYAARENLYELCLTGDCPGLTPAYIALEAKRYHLPLPPELSRYSKHN